MSAWFLDSELSTCFTGDIIIRHIPNLLQTLDNSVYKKLYYTN